MASFSSSKGGLNARDVVELLAWDGAATKLLRLWHDGEPFLCRPQVAAELTESTDKRFRNAYLKALQQEEQVSAASCLAGRCRPLLGLLARAEALRPHSLARSWRPRRRSSRS